MCFAIAIVIILGCIRVSAQSIQYGKLTGSITAETGEALPGVSVEISSPALVSGTRSTTTTITGSYVFLNLPVGVYKITATLEGFKTAIHEGIVIDAGSAATIDIPMAVGGINESITVTATGPVIDTRNSTVETRLDKELIEKLPTSRDAFYDLALTAPGMFDAGKDASWLPSPTAYGSGTNENAFLVNGVNTTNPRGGSFGSLVNVNYNAIEEVRIVSLGAKAEYGSSTGVAVDVITKSGSNELGGNVSVFSQLGTPSDNMPDPSNFDDRGWLVLDPTTHLVSKTHKDEEFNATLGGPIVKNKAWFYGGFDYVREDLKKPLWPVILSSKGRYADIKVTTEPLKNNRAWMAYHFERGTDSGDTWGDNVPWDSELQFGDAKTNHTISSEWQWFPSSTNLLTFKYLGFWTDWNPNPPENAPQNPGYINWWKWQAFGVNGHFPFIEGRNANRQTIQADFSKYIEDFLGEQDIKFGVQYTKGHDNELNGYFVGYGNFAYPLRWNQDINYCVQNYGDTGMLWYVNQTFLPPTLTATQFKQGGFFFDDQWTPMKRLTVNVGLRFDNMSNKYGIGKVYDNPTSPNDVPDNLRVVRDRKGTDNVFDFNNWSPRIGATYTITEDGKTVVRGNFGRYYSPVGTENLRRVGPDMPLLRTHELYMNIPWDLVDLNHNGYIDPEEVTAAARLLKGRTPYADKWTESDPSWLCKVAPGTKNQFSDQLTCNFEREIMRDLSFSATFMHKRTGNILMNWPINRATGKPYEYERKHWTTPYGREVDLYSIVWKDYNGDGVVDLNDVEWINLNTDYVVQNLPKGFEGIDSDRTFNGLQFVLNKHYADRWQMLFSFLYSDSNGPANRTNYQDWNIEGPEIMDAAFVSSPNQLLNNTGPLPFTSKYEVKLSGTYQIPKTGIDVGARFRYNSGRAYWFLAEYPRITPDTQPVNGVIDTGNLIVGIDPNKPLRLPPEKILDLRLERTIDMGKYNNLTVSFDVFNIFNSNTVVNADYQYDPGKVTAVVAPPRKFKLGVSYTF